MKRKLFYTSTFFCILFFASANFQIFAQDTRAFNIDRVFNAITNENRAKLEKQALTNITNKYDKPRLLYTPNLPLFDSALDFIKKKKPTILYESLYFLEEPNIEKQTQLFLAVSNLLRNVPILATIEYQNLKDGNIHPIFHSSEAIVSSSSTQTTDSLPSLIRMPLKLSKETIYVKQEMPPFGQVISKYQYSYDNYYSAFIGTNTSNISYSNIKAVKISNMLTSCWIIQIEEGILIYGIGAVKLSGFASLFANVISNSFTSRMVGLFSWLNQEISNAQGLHTNASN